MRSRDATAKKSWDPLTRAVIVREVILHAVLLAVGWSSGLGYLGLMAILGAELLVMTLLSIAIYPERGAKARAVSLVLFVFMLAFLGFFVVVTYHAVHGADPRTLPLESPLDAIRLDVDVLTWTLGYTAVHLLAMFVYARLQPNPRGAWSGQVLMQGSVTMMAIFLMIFVTLALGLPLVGLLHDVVDTEGLLILLMVLVRLSMALVMSKMPQAERDEIAANPYAH